MQINREGMMLHLHILKSNQHVGKDGSICNVFWNGCKLPFSLICGGMKMTETGSRKRGRRGSPESWSVDAHVGQRVRMRRTLLGVSQEKLGEAIGLTFQQVQKYERGTNRISAGTLYRLSLVLDVPVSFFFDCYDAPQASVNLADSPANNGAESGISRREARLLRLWRSAPEPVASEMLALLSSLSSESENDDDGAKTATNETALVRTAPAAGRKGRRRHGAVWDPADIASAARE